jgi:hypothetical protein
MEVLRTQVNALLGVLVRPAFTLIPALLLITAALLVLCTNSPYTPRDAELLLSITVFFVFYSAGVAAPVLLSDIRRLRLPGRWPLLAYAGRLLLVLVIVTVLVPGALLGVIRGSLSPLFVLGSGALTGLLIQRMPMPVVAVIFVVVLLRNLIPGVVHHHLSALLTPFPWLAHPWVQLQAAFDTLAVLAAWRWWRILCGDGQALEAAARTARIISGRYTQPDSHVAQAPWWSSVRLDTAHRGEPARVIRTCLGPLHAPTYGVGRALRLAAEVGVATGVFLLWGAWRLGWHWGWRVAVFLGVFYSWAAFGQRIIGVLLRVNGELAELALLPGLGDRRAQLRALYRACLVPPLLVGGIIAVAGIVAALIENVSLEADGRVLLWMLSTMLLGVTATVTALVGQRRIWPSWIAILCLFVALIAWMLIASGTHTVSDLPARPLARWLAVPGACCVILIISARRLNRLPHPFVLR